MPDFDPHSQEPALSRSYLRGLACATALLCLYCLINVLADPTGEFGLSGRFDFNRAPPPEAIAEGEAGNDPAFYARAIRESAANVFLIGTSRTWRGFDTCSRPDLLRVAGTAWGISELARVQQSVLESRDRPATLLVEIGLPEDEGGRIGSPLANAISVALSPRTFVLSLRTIAGSVNGQPAPAYIRCAPFPSPRTDWAEAARTLRAAVTLVDATPASLSHGRANVLALADAADRVCARTGIRHHLVYFSLPPTPAGSPAPALDQIIQLNSARLASAFARRPHPARGCSILYANYTRDPPGPAALRLLWRDRRHWSDFAHYGPELGEFALQPLLDAARAN